MKTKVFRKVSMNENNILVETLLLHGIKEE